MADHLDRASTLLDIVQKIASIAPTYTAISSIAMMELKEMNEDAQKHLNKIADQRLRNEQQAAAELNRKNQEAANRQAEIDREIAERTAASNAVQPIQVLPGEPNPMVDINKAQGLTPEGDPSTNPADDPTPHEHDDGAPVARRV